MTCKKFSDVKVAVLGDIMCDEYVHCQVMGLSPESDTALKLRVESRNCRPGGAANVALNLRALGAGVVHLYGHIADDQAGKDVRSFLDDKEVVLVNASLPGYRTTVKSRVITRMGNHICRLDSERIHTADPVFLPIFGSIFGKYDAIVISDYDKGVITAESMRGMRRLGIPFYVDPKKKDWSIYEGAEAITPNEMEATKAPADYPSKRLIITRGKEGCTLLKKEGKGADVGFNIPVASKQVGDPTGCGDSFIAGLVMSRCLERDWLSSCIFANACGAVAFGHVGAKAVTEDLVLAELKGNPLVYRREAAQTIGGSNHEVEVSGPD